MGSEARTGLPQARTGEPSLVREPIVKKAGGAEDPAQPVIDRAERSKLIGEAADWGLQRVRRADWLIRRGVEVVPDIPYFAPDPTGNY